MVAAGDGDDDGAAMDEDGAASWAASDGALDGAVGDVDGDCGRGTDDGDGEREPTGDWSVSDVLLKTKVSILTGGDSSSESLI